MSLTSPSYSPKSPMFNPSPDCDPRRQPSSHYISPSPVFRPSSPAPAIHSRSAAASSTVCPGFAPANHASPMFPVFAPAILASLPTAVRWNEPSLSYAAFTRSTPDMIIISSSVLSAERSTQSSKILRKISVYLSRRDECWRRGGAAQTP